MIQRQNRKAAESQSIANVNNVMQPSCRRRFLTWQVNRGNRLIFSVRIQWYAPYRDFADPPKGVRLDNCLNQQDIPRTILPT